MKTTKKAISIVLAGLMTAGSMSALSVFAVEETSPTLSFKTQNALYAHAVSGSADSDAWVAWQCEHNEYMNEINANQKYFFLPSSVSSTSVELYNAYSNNVTVNNVTIPSGESREVSYTIDKSTSVSAGGKTYSLTFLKSSAESAIYVNNSNADGNGSELISYLSEDKSNSASATGAIVDRNGKIDNTSIKKIKGRGNSTWVKAKKPFNITYSDKVSIGGMAKSKKFSLLANYQDDSLTRNRFLYDLADAVGTPYASDSRYVDFYSDGYYWGSYQMTEKIEVGKNALINDIDDTAYLDADGNVNKDFPFLCEVDSNAVDGEDYYVKCNDGIKVTIKAPELSEGDKGYNEVKNYVREKYNAFHNAAKNTAIIRLKTAPRINQVFQAFTLFISRILTVTISSSAHLYGITIIRSVMLQAVLGILRTSVLRITHSIQAGGADSRTDKNALRAAPTLLTTFQETFRLIRRQLISGLRSLFRQSTTLQAKLRTIRVQMSFIQKHSITTFSRTVQR